MVPGSSTASGPTEQPGSIQVEAGSITALLGRNGAGKSTLIQICLGLLEPTDGRVTVLGGNPWDREIRRRIGYMPEESTLHPFLTGKETLLFHAGLCGLPGDYARERAAYLLDLVELSPASDREVREYSKGMARRLCLAQALIGDPELLFLDEPTSGLDPLGTRLVKDLLLKLKSLGRTVFLSSHLLGEVEEVADSIAILERGKILLSGRSEELLGGKRTEIAVSPATDELAEKIRSFLKGEGEFSVRLLRDHRSLEDLFLSVVLGHDGERRQETEAGKERGG